MKILILGAGGIGGYFGARLVKSGAEVTFLVRPKRHEQLGRYGLAVKSPNGDMKLKVKTVLAEDLQPGYDIVLFTCKSYDLDSAMDAIAPAMDGHCALVPLLNGISHMERLDARFGAKQVLGGTAQIIVTLASDGTVLHLEPLNRILFGERDGSMSPRSTALAAALEKSGITTVHSDNVMLDMWEKVVFLSALAALTCVFRANNGEIMATPDGRVLVERCLDANIAIAVAEGFSPREGALKAYRARLTDASGKVEASMLRDLEGGKPVEADHIVGFMLDLARKHKIDDAVLAVAYTHLKAYEARRAAGRLK
ncbi:2-dehydropantoate 2-reductase [Usitatibacter palustris]|uniref:2-dehydropantoate 2-reductase n=1 Tax=Usitatibacter palustris TaxID=2732487 RepID=A0A6M4HBN8_9PROT|nr:2-dehydropantoate 2-reductase [Usitatibacter palustris]QJR16033.1 2-dehydropantoate 2-reductase [Usitatibacter palustris]